MTWYDVIFPFRRRITSQLNHTKTLQFIPPQHHWCDTSSWMTTIFLRWITNILFDFILIKYYIRRRHSNKSHLIYLITVIFFFFSVAYNSKHTQRQVASHRIAECCSLDYAAGKQAASPRTFVPIYTKRPWNNHSFSVYGIGKLEQV